MSISLDNPFIVTETKIYLSFSVLSIKIEFGQSAKILIQLFEQNSSYLGINKTIDIPLEVYTNWSFNETQITDYIKLQLST